MSAGKFERVPYDLVGDDGVPRSNCYIVVQPESLDLNINGFNNFAAVRRGDSRRFQFEIRVTQNTRERGAKARMVRLQWVNDRPPGVTGNRVIVPVPRIQSWNAYTPGSTGVHRGFEVEVLGRIAGNPP